MSSLKKNLVCIVCPRGCRLTLTLPEDGLSAPETIIRLFICAQGCIVFF